VRRRRGHTYTETDTGKGYKHGLGSFTWVNKLMYSAFMSWLTFTSQHFIKPVSAAGRLYLMIVCFVWLGLVAAYTANLATIFTTAAIPVQTISYIQDMVAKGAKLCVKVRVCGFTGLGERRSQSNPLCMGLASGPNPPGML